MVMTALSQILSHPLHDFQIWSLKLVLFDPIKINKFNNDAKDHHICSSTFDIVCVCVGLIYDSFNILFARRWYSNETVTVQSTNCDEILT